MDNTVPRKHPDDVSFMPLYEELLDVAGRRSAGHGLQYPALFAFSRGEVENALRLQGIHDQDMGAGIACALDHGVLEKKGDTFHLVAEKLSVYKVVEQP
mgnify:CR=1 FL=1